MTSLKYVKTELFNPDAMQLLLRHDGIDFGTRQRLQKYYKRRKNGNRVEVVYDFCKDYSAKVGRVYAYQGLGLVGMSRDIRNALAKDLYWDVDMVNAHHNILVQLCEQKGWKCEGLKHYVNNRERVLNEIMLHYGCSHKDAKNLMIRLLFLGHPEAWVGDSVCERHTHQMPFIEGLRQELMQVGANVWSTHTEVSNVVNRKKKHTQVKKISSCLSLVLQSIEHEMLMAIDDCLISHGRSMDSYIFDGGLVRRLKDETEMPENILRACEQHVKSVTGFQVQLLVKPLDTTFEIQNDDTETIPSHIIIDDMFAAKAFVKLMEGKIVYTEDKLFVFDETTGLWSSDKVALLFYVDKFEYKLKFKQFNIDTGKDKVYNYSGCDAKLANMLKFVPAYCVSEDFFNKHIDTSRGKLLFSNGIYDFDTDTFTEGFNSNIVFKDRIDRPFPSNRNENMLATVNKILFEDPFMENEKSSSDFLRIALVRALYGDYRAKQFYFCVGKSNAGKGVMADALKATFGGFVGTFNAKSLAYNDNSSADAAKQLSWVFGIKDKRIAISSEISMSKAFDGNLVKSLASGGDECDARKNHKDETKVVNRSTMFVFNNDIPMINPLDDGVVNRVKCVEFNCVFKTADEVSLNFERVADKDLKDKFEKDTDYQDALVWLMVDAYQSFKEHGHNVPDGIKQATKEWTGDMGSVAGLLDMKYEVTRKETDFVQARYIIDYLTKEKQLKMSETKIGRELAGLKLVKKDLKIKGKTVRVWCGLKERFGSDYMINDVVIDDAISDPLDAMTGVDHVATVDG